MSKRYNDAQNEPKQGSKPIVTLESEAAVQESAAGAEQPEAARVEAAPSDEVAALEVEIDKLNAALKGKEKEIAELKDKYLRTLAETENVRRRIRQQSEESLRLQRENLLRDLLPIVDNLERAVDAARSGSSGNSIIEGVELVLVSMLEFLKQQGVTPQPSVGTPFDPAHHEAIDHVQSDVHPPNTVVHEFHRGYKVGDRVLRPARVVVAKGGPEEEKRRNSEDNGNDVEKA